MTGRDELKCGACHCLRIDAVMRPESFVFIDEQQLQELRIDILRRRRQPPTSLLRGIGAQQFAIAVEHGVRIGQILPERRRPERINERRAGERDHCGRAADPRNNEAPVFHFPAISTVPVAVRPKRSGRYMSSTFACGST